MTKIRPITLENIEVIEKSMAKVIKMNFKTASGQEMQHYGERVVKCITHSRPDPKVS